MYEVAQPFHAEPERLERSPACRECGGRQFRRLDWIEEVREPLDGFSREVPEASFGEHLWCEACGTSCELPLEVEYH